jgi:hypothetical protein
VSAVQVPKLRSFLTERATVRAGRTPAPGLSIADLFEIEFGGRHDAVSALQTALEAEGIPSSFWAWR